MSRHGDYGGFYSQFGENKQIFENYMRNRESLLPRGKFIELGAIGGITFSNTKFFKDYLGWTGVLI